MPKPRDRKFAAEVGAFTLIELLVVITIIVVLMGLLFPAFRGVQDQAKRTQAKNDLTQIVTAVNAFYTEYGKYPVAAATDVTLPGNEPQENLMDCLRGLPGAATQNPKQIVFISPPDAKDAANPRSGIGSDRKLYDPWGKNTANADAGLYHIKIDGDYDNEVDNPYPTSANAGPAKLRNGIVVWSFGKNGIQDPDIKVGDDVISWQ